MTPFLPFDPTGGAGGAPTGPGDAQENSEEPREPWAEVPVRRFDENPLIRPGMLPADDGENINGPCLLHVPEWVPEPLGKYYLYFAHHGGHYIRLAWADRLRGPWHIHEPGVLHLRDLPMQASHVASPEILVDEANRSIRLYFHVPLREEPVTSGPHRDARWPGQTTHVALSADGLRFEARPEVLSSSYLRVFRHQGKLYGICMSGLASAALCRSADGLTTFERGPDLYPHSRHWALLRRGDRMWAFFSRIGDAPERILATRFDLRKDWAEWGPDSPGPITVLRPEADYEGAGYAIEPSVPSAGTGVRQLRDPYLYEDDGRVILFYTVAGESGIAAAEVTLTPTDE